MKQIVIILKNVMIIKKKHVYIDEDLCYYAF
jgi:hypothetical protein